MSFNELLAEAVELADQEDITLTESVLDDEVESLLEGVEEALFESGVEDFAPNFDANIDSFQFFNNSYVKLPEDELDRMYNPDVSADLNNSHSHEHLSEGYNLNEDESIQMDYKYGGVFDTDLRSVEEVIFNEEDENEDTDDKLEEDFLGENFDFLSEAEDESEDSESKEENLDEDCGECDDDFDEFASDFDNWNDEDDEDEEFLGENGNFF